MPILVMIALIGAEMFASLEASMIYTALPTMARDFADLQSASWLISIYVLMQAGTAAIGGRLGDIFGRRRLIVIAIAISGVGSLISALGGTIETVILGRALQGCCGAVLPLSFGIVREVCPPEKRALWVGILTGAYSGSGAIGFLLGGLLVDLASWRWIFWITAILSVFIAALVLIWVPVGQRRPQVKQLDILGGVLFAPGVGITLYALTKASEWGWTSVSTLGALAGGGVLLALWVWRELTHEDPLIDVRLLRDKQIILGNTLALIIGLGSFQMPFLLNLLLQQPVWTGVGLGVSAALAGILKLPSNIFSAIAAAVSGHLAGRRGARFAALVGALIAVASWVGLTLSHDNLWIVVFGMVCANVGNAIILAASPILVLGAVPAERSSEATGLTSVSRAIGTAAGAQIVALLLATSSVQAPDSTHVYPDAAAFVLALGYIAVTAILSLGCALLIPRKGAARA